MYNENYYKRHQDGSYQSALQILKYLKSFIDFKSVIDFGCGMGTWCKALGELKISDFLGIDQHTYDVSYMIISKEKYLQYDLRKPLTLSKKTDIVISVEVAEHIEPEYSSIFISNLCSHSDIVLFSAALPGQGGTNHVNEQLCSYWVNLFAQKGFALLDCIRPYVWNNETVEIWYRNNTLLFIADCIYDSIASKIVTCPFPVDIIHPGMLERILKKRG